MKIAGMFGVLLLITVPHQTEARQQNLPRPMTKEEGRKFQQYALKQCKGVPSASAELVMCIQAVHFRVMKLWNAGQTPPFLK